MADKPKPDEQVADETEAPEVEEDLVTMSREDLTEAIAEAVRQAQAEADKRVVRPAVVQSPEAPEAKLPARVKGWREKYDPETVEWCLSLTNPGRHQAAQMRQIFKQEQAIASGQMQRAPIYGDEGAADGNYLVPEEMIKMILTDRDNLVELAPLVTTHNVTSHHGTVPQGGDVSVTWAGESTAFTESNPTFTEETWQAYRVNAITTLSRNLIDDAQMDVVAYVSGRLAKAFALERDRMVAIGNNTNQPYGIYYLAGSDYSVGGALTYRALVDGFATLASRYRVNAVFAMSDTNWARILGLVDTTGQPLIRAEAMQEGAARRLLGKRVVLQDDIPNGFILFGDPKEYHIFDRQQLGVEMSSEGTVGSVNLFESHAVGTKGWERYDGVLPSAMTGSWIRLTGITA